MNDLPAQPVFDMERLRDRHPCRDCCNPKNCPLMQDFGGQVIYVPGAPAATRGGNKK
jgi:hypothetical protein